MSLPNTSEYWEEQEYIQQYGVMPDLVEYEKITGKDWSKALLAFDPASQSLIKFHKEVVLPLLTARN
jgi:hypothetical protein